MGIEAYSTTPALNVSVNGINIAELCPAGNLNDAQRQVMADIKTWYDFANPKLSSLPTFPLSIANGGTGQTTAAAARDALLALDVAWRAVAIGSAGASCAARLMGTAAAIDAPRSQANLDMVLTPWKLTRGAQRYRRCRSKRARTMAGRPRPTEKRPAQPMSERAGRIGAISAQRSVGSRMVSPATPFLTRSLPLRAATWKLSR